MNTIAGLTKVRGGVVVLGLAVLSGCAVTTGGAPPSQLGLNSLPTASYTMCRGGHASRLPAHEAVGRVCRPSSSLQVIL